MPDRHSVSFEFPPAATRKRQKLTCDGEQATQPLHGTDQHVNLLLCDLIGILICRRHWWDQCFDKHIGCTVPTRLQGNRARERQVIKREYMWWDIH